MFLVISYNDVCNLSLVDRPTQQLIEIFRRNDSQESVQDNDDLPLITCESLPKSPRLANPHRVTGPVVHYRLLAFPLPSDALLKWVENNQLGVGKRPHTRRLLALPAILHRLTADCRRLAVVVLDTDAPCYSVVVATNKTLEDLARAEDLEMIQSVQRVLATTEPPAWYRPQKPW